MRILHVIPLYNPMKPFGGSQAVLHATSQMLVEKGHEIVIYTSDLANLSTRGRNFQEPFDGITIIRSKCVSSFLASNTRFIFTPGMIKLLNATIHTFDVVHIHEARGYQQVIASKIAKNHHIPYVIQPHGNYSRVFKGVLRSIFDLGFGRKMVSSASKLIALNHFEAEQLLRLGIDRNKLTIIPNGVDLQLSCNIQRGRFKQRYKIDSESKIFLFLGRIHPIKNVDLIIRAYASLTQYSTNTILVIAGQDDGHLEVCQNLTKDLGLIKKVIFTGPIHGTKKLEALVDADVFVLPSKYETFSMSILEAYSCGIPVIASAISGLKDIILDKKTGVYVKPGSVHELSRAMGYVLENKRKMQSFIGEFSKRFDIVSVVEKLERLYNDLRME